MKSIFLSPKLVLTTIGILFLSTILMNCNSTKEIGLQLYSIRTDMDADVKGSIEKVGAMGYSFVEAAGYSDGKFYGMEPDDFKNLVETNGMKLLGSHSGPHITDEPGSMENALAEWDAIIAAHKQAGVEYIVKPSMGGYSYASLEGLQKTCEYFNAIGAKCNAAGLRFGYHNHAKEFTELEGEIIYDYMLKNTDPDKVMFQLDLYWIYKGGKVANDYFKAYPGRFENWHVKDVAELGDSGEIEFEPIFKDRKLSGVKHLVVEVEEYNFEPLVSVEKSLVFMNEAPYIK